MSLSTSTGTRKFFRESGVEENVQGEEQDLEDKILYGEFRSMSRAHKTDPEEETCSVTDSSIDDNSRKSGIDTYHLLRQELEHGI